jgi:hypothetical protein
MNEQPEDRDEAELERQARTVFNASVDALDAATLSRLNRSRQRAMALAEGRKRAGWRWEVWAPAGAVAAGALAAVLLLNAPPEMSAPAHVATTAASGEAQQDAFELLTAGEDLDLATEADLEFYAWVELETSGDDDGVG